MSVGKEEILNFNDTEEVEEGYPKVASGEYLARVTEPTVVLGKASGLPYVEYTPVLLESKSGDGPTVDKNGLSIRGFKLLKDRIILFANTVDSRGDVKTDAKYQEDARRMVGMAKGIVRKLTGEVGNFWQGTKQEIAQEVANAIKGATFVAVVGLQKGTDEYPAKNVIREHKSEDSW